MKTTPRTGKTTHRFVSTWSRASWGTVGAVFIATMLSASAAAASEIDTPRLQVGTRLGYGMLLGNLEGGGSTVGETLYGQVPLWLDVGYRVTPRVVIGGYFQYNFLVGNDPDHLCSGDASCSAIDKRFGLQASYRFSSLDKSSLWVGVGAGYETMDLKMVIAGEELSYSLRGYEYGSVQAGYVIKTGTFLDAGPFVSFSMGRFDTSKTKTFSDTNASPKPIDNRAMHQWFVFGGRGTFDI